MRWLAVESATIVASVAVGEDDRVLSEVTSHSTLTHSERLLPMVDQALALAGVELATLDRLVVAAGPGSFTGLRIGLATVKGLAQARQLPVAAVSTLEALAWQQQSAGLLVPLLDARRAQVYAAVYRQQSPGLATVQAPTAIALSELLLSLQGQSPLFIGEGASIYRREILAELPEARFAHALHNWPRAGSLGLWHGRDGREAVDSGALQPIYLRASSAEQQAK